MTNTGQSLCAPPHGVHVICLFFPSLSWCQLSAREKNGAELQKQVQSVLSLSCDELTRLK